MSLKNIYWTKYLLVKKIIWQILTSTNSSTNFDSLLLLTKFESNKILCHPHYSTHLFWWSIAFILILLVSFILQIEAHDDDVNTVRFADESSQILYSGGDDGLCKVKPSWGEKFSWTSTEEKSS